ncbi:GNAT family N-acetyltransferase [Jidongwangia harbinensis]|uniref:GNAT family N-acetyltransferase n=1 Tax=Jidongwangia harbinensis TaxID=2878561 RepID=UPI001CDA0CF8|nr:GNAT family protein [Jidongwangia harbinensis]
MKVLATADDSLKLRELGPADAAEYYALVQRNAAHLTMLGDYHDEVASNATDVAYRLAQRTEISVRFGVYLQERLVGRVDLIPVEPPRYGLGYWLSEEVTGRGYATAAVAALLRYAGEELGATDVFAGVTRGNVRSEALLQRLGFEVVADFDSYRRFHHSLSHP